MKKIFCVLTVAMALAFTAQAQDDPRAKAKEKWEKLSPEQQAKIKERRADMKAKWDAMTPEQQAAAKQKLQEMREKLKTMTPEERKAFAEQHKRPKRG